MKLLDRLGQLAFGHVLNPLVDGENQVAPGDGSFDHTVLADRPATLEVYEAVRKGAPWP